MACLITVLFGVQAFASSVHEIHHSAASYNESSSYGISALTDACSICAVQHAKTDAPTVQLEPSKTGVIPPIELWTQSEALTSFFAVTSQARAPPAA